MKSVVLLKSALFRQGGLEKYARRLALAFKNQGCQVTVLTTNVDKGQSLDPSIKIISHRMKSKMSFMKVKEFDHFCSNFLKAHQADLVLGLDRNQFQTHLRAGNGSHLAYLTSRIQQEGKWAAFRHLINPLHRTILHLEKISFEHPDLKTLFTNSHMVKEEILEFYQIDPHKLQVIHNGVEWQEMSPHFSLWEEHKRSSLVELGLNTDTFKFLFIGHNYRRKGLEKLLQGLSLLKTKEFELLVIGKDKNRSFFQSLVKKLKLTEKVHFLGERSDVMRFYQLADCLVIPSFYDPFANVTLEALAMGLPVVSSKSNGGHEILSSENGRVIESLNAPESIAEALSWALHRPKNSVRALQIRNSIKYLDFSQQLTQFTQLCLQ